MLEIPNFKGYLKTDALHRRIYATDASVYQEEPLGVAFPQTENDLIELVKFARRSKIGLIPRTAGTSLAGQVVGKGLIVDLSKYMTKILEVNSAKSQVRLQPGVIRNELNQFLKSYGLYFGPETSTANRAMLGGMVGNNSCGSNSVIYGSTRDHLARVKMVLSDGNLVSFEAVDKATFLAKTKLQTLEGKIYRHILALLGNSENRANILKHYPKATIPRRNTGYALDLLLDSEMFDNQSDKPFNFCKLIAGSEGTLGLISEITLNLSPLPPPHSKLVCVHFESIRAALEANLIILNYKPYACELIDHYVIECTQTNLEQRQNAFFITGEPKAILIVDLRENDPQILDNQVQNLIRTLKENQFGYAYPVIEGEAIAKVWDLRRAGLGLLSNVPGDAKPVAVIEDTAVDVHDLPQYITDFNRILEKYELYSVHYAHAGSGELHLRPIINLKTTAGKELFKTIAREIAQLVKKYRGSLSGEHGDGRLRGEFIPFMIGEANYNLLKDLKKTWDPANIFNPDKIVNTPAMNTGLRYLPDQQTPDLKTIFDFSQEQGILRATEMCNGSGDCRKTELTGGTMCPSYMASREERDTTRARANLLRHVLTHNSAPFKSEELKTILDRCLSCKGCKRECPSNVDVAKLKAEFLYQYYKHNPLPLRTWLVANITSLNALTHKVAGLYNFIFRHRILGTWFKKGIGFATKRSMPTLYKQTLRGWYSQHYTTLKPANPIRQVLLFCDEFTNYNEVELGIKAIKLLTRLNYDVVIPKHLESGRSYLSKGLLNQAKSIIAKNVDLLADKVSAQKPLIGLEPSALLTFRDEALDLVDESLKVKAKQLAKYSFLLEEFMTQAAQASEITSQQFTAAEKTFKVHVHCYQKALTSLTPIKKALSLISNYKICFIQSGCCGMAGSFGYEAEHYDLSMAIGELVLFPTIRKTEAEVGLIANGTSCRHQILDGTKRRAYHVAEIFYEALR